MVKKFFLALDYVEYLENIRIGLNALENVSKEFGEDFIKERMGVKLNLHSLIGDEIKRFTVFRDRCSIFADVKIKHGPNTGKLIISKVKKYLPADFFTVDASLGSKILKDYVKIADKLNSKIIAFTVHTKIPSEDAEKIYKSSVKETIYNLGSIAAEAGCDAIVLEARLLGCEKIRNLPIRKLVTGIRIDPSDKGAQARVSSLEEVKSYKNLIDYVVISSRYLDNWKKLSFILYSLV